jgi:DNA-binding beta-propeller fold protein YncE
MASVLATVSLASAPCNGQHPISVTALADGSRVYVADRDGGNNGGQVCVLNTTSNAFTKNIPILSVTFDDQGNPIPVIPTRPIFIASDSDSFRVYTANSGSADVSVIQTADDTLVMVPAQNDIPAEPLTFCGGPPHIKSTPKGFVTTCPLDFVPTYIAMTP